MSSSTALSSHAGPEGRRPAFLPREHGFWTMLAAVVLVAVARGGASPSVLLVAAAVVTGVVVSGSIFRRSIRRHGGLQVLSAVGMSLAGIPIEVAGKVEQSSIALTVVAWAVIFASLALCVRATFARASRKRRAYAPWLQVSAVVLPFAATVLFGATGAGAQAMATLIATSGCMAIGVKKPDVKQTKAVGLFLAAVTALSALALAAL